MSVCPAISVRLYGWRVRAERPPPPQDTVTELNHIKLGTRSETDIPRAPTARRPLFPAAPLCRAEERHAARSGGDALRPHLLRRSRVNTKREIEFSPRRSVIDESRRGRGQTFTEGGAADVALPQGALHAGNVTHTVCEHTHAHLMRF